jgi:hypothetical protein
MKDSEVLAEIKAREELIARGYTWTECAYCGGRCEGHRIGGVYIQCACNDRGGYWLAPTPPETPQDAPQC